MKEVRPSRAFRFGTPKVSLARALSKLGYCSRTRAMELIGAGRVRVNGRGERDGARRVDPAKDRIEVEGRVVTPSEKVYLMLNKPRGLVTSAADEKGRATVYEGLKDCGFPWLVPVGRLDKASEGLLLFTNDTRWAARIMAPQTHLDKTYHVQVDRVADEGFLKKMTEGVEAEEGDFLQARKASLLRKGKRNCWLEVVLQEGKNRHLRRLLSALGVNVLRLVRVAIGPLQLGALGKGEVRLLTGMEKECLSKTKPKI
ncbi:MAG: pseudouridine synthase [Deltaproteobacteria bacterium]|nr:pseudouridine synthase [Deltaproteobacteria bacterium]